jgi:hypothetical protein
MRAFWHAKSQHPKSYLLSKKNLIKSNKRLKLGCEGYRENFGEKKLLMFVTMRNHKKQGAIW